MSGAALSDPALTTVVLVTRADKGAIIEAARTSEESHELGLPALRALLSTAVPIGERAHAAPAQQITHVRGLAALADGLVKRLFTLPWLTVPPIGFAELSRLVLTTHEAAPAQD